jgi:chromosome segregation ATPase
MNDERRKAINEAIKTLDSLSTQRKKIDTDLHAAVEEFNAKWATIKASIEELKNGVSDLKDSIESIKDEEEEYLGNMPEGLQSGEKGEKAQAAIDALDSAMSSLEEITELELDDEVDPGVTLDLDPLDTAHSSLEEARDV